MSERNVIQTTFDGFGKESGCAKKSGSWYRRSDETIVVLNLQKSNYGTAYYVNVALWLLALGEVDAPKENKCHVRTRLDDLVPSGTQGRLTELLDLETPIDEATRRDELFGLLGEHLL